MDATLPAPDPWVADLVPAWTAENTQPALDVACGSGRNALWLAAAGLEVAGVDRAAGAVARARAAARRLGLPSARFRVRDVEADGLPEGPWGAVVVCRYLHRPLLPRLSEVLRPGGWLVYRTHLAHPIRAPGARPRRRAFLLDSGELLRAFAHLEVLRYEERAGPDGAWAGLVARRPYSS